jgi:hypothetical protein
MQEIERTKDAIEASRLTLEVAERRRAERKAAQRERAEAERELRESRPRGRSGISGSQR